MSKDVFETVSHLTTLLKIVVFCWLGFPGNSDGKEFFQECRRPRFDPWVGKIPWRMEWQPTLVFVLGNPMDRGTWQATVPGVIKSQTRLSNKHCLPGKGQRNLVGCSPWACRVGHDWATSTHFAGYIVAFGDGDEGVVQGGYHAPGWAQQNSITFINSLWSTMIMSFGKKLL